jgi:cyanate permease
MLQLVTQTASGLGPYALGLLHEAFGGYERGLWLLAGVAGVAALLVSQVREPDKP